jgi:DNA-binding NarL/FixJ family response regulator
VLASGIAGWLADLRRGSDGREVLAKVAELKPDIIVLDVAMPNLNGLEATRQILKTNPKAKVLVLTLHDTDRLIHEVLTAGASGFVLKSDAARDLQPLWNACGRTKLISHPRSLPWC